MTVYAHSTPDPDYRVWEPLADHLAAVGDTASRFAGVFGWGAVAGLSGRLHDIGKCSAAFQAYLRQERSSGGDHSGAGARETLAGLPAPVGQMLAAIVAGHHAGLAYGVALDERLRGPLPPYPGWQAHSGPLPAPATLAPTRPFAPSPDRGFSGVFLTRMLFSCLVDADSLETERFYAGAEVDRGPFRDLATLRDRLDAHMAAVAAAADPTPLNALRAEVLAYAKAQASLVPGLFTLTVPTGGGKTLASLSFALDHAVRHGLRRIVYVIPFTEAWIETLRNGCKVAETWVASRAEAWIETAMATPGPLTNAPSPPVRRRGSKRDPIRVRRLGLSSPPVRRRGSNICSNGRVRYLGPSPPCGAWIETSSSSPSSPSLSSLLVRGMNAMNLSARSSRGAPRGSSWPPPERPLREIFGRGPSSSRSPRGAGRPTSSARGSIARWWRRRRGARATSPPCEGPPGWRAVPARRSSGRAAAWPIPPWAVRRRSCRNRRRDSRSGAWRSSARGRGGATPPQVGVTGRATAAW
ncbi:MAG: CRISPR-associated endonuclease Cas3'' [Janthinobacterium lividum]